ERQTLARRSATVVRLFPACRCGEIGNEMKSAAIVAVVLIWLVGCGGRTSPWSPTAVRTASSRPARLRVSQGVMEQSRIRYVKPVYPADPQKQGDVTVWFWIDTDGTVEKVTAVDGDPMLAEAAVEAVKR